MQYWIAGDSSGMDKKQATKRFVMFAAEGRLRVATKQGYETLGLQAFSGPSGPDFEAVEKLHVEKLLFP